MTFEKSLGITMSIWAASTSALIWLMTISNNPNFTMLLSAYYVVAITAVLPTVLYFKKHRLAERQPDPLIELQHN